MYETHTIPLEQIGQPENLQKLHWLFTDPERLRPGQTRDAVTEKVAKAFACIAQRLRDHGHDPHKTAHFVNRLLFCMFAEDIELLPDRLFTRMLETCEHAPQRFAPMASELFAKMNTGGYFGADEIAWFNGGLFNDGEALPLDADGVKQTLIAARMDWSSIEPSIFGWMIGHGFSANRKPILNSLHTIENRDALIVIPEGFNREPTEEDQNRATNTHELTRIKEAEWPEAEFIVGNPPFLGDKKMIAELGEEYAFAIRNLYKGRVPGAADFVAYWFARAGEHVQANKTERVGFVATQSMRAGANRKVLERILDTVPIFEAWSDEPWVVDGADVRVSLVCFGENKNEFVLDGKPSNEIHADLSASSIDLTKSVVLGSNQGCAFQGPVKVGAFDISGKQARSYLVLPSNPNGRPNSDVVRPWSNGLDITRRHRDMWIIDFGIDMDVAAASLYEQPFEYVMEFVKPFREKGRREIRKKYWWRHGETVPALRVRLSPLTRYIVTPRVAKYRLFVWLDKTVLPDSRLYAFAFEDDSVFGILHSRIHEVWSLATCSMHGVGNDPTYNAKSCFETFPFPPGFSFVSSCLCGEVFDLISVTAKRLDELRNNWLNPPEWVERIPEVVEGFPDRIIAKPSHEADLKKRTLTNLYNARPAWLDNIHKELDAAVATAYGWDDYTPAMPDEEILARLFKLNQERYRG
ncbi:MAG: hypothetical protein Q9M16_04125 [Mariprofundus sp.]|nr:hypothetical protein [Mariprofundus sp.]